MGAVYALFAAWYFWSPKFDGLTYNDTKGKIHFWGMFIGVKDKLAPSLVFTVFALFKNECKGQNVYSHSWGKDGIIQLNKILFDTRNSFLDLNKNYLNFIKGNYSKNLLYLRVLCARYQFKFYLFFKFFLLTKNYLNAQLVEVKDSVNDITDIQKASQRLNTKDIQWLVGFTDGDGCLTMYKENKWLNNWRHEYAIGLSIKDIRLLYKIKDILGCGTIIKYNNLAIFKIKKIKHLIYIIIPIFDKYPLLTEKKRLIYLNFRNSLLKKALISKINMTNDDIIYVKQLLDNIPDNLYSISIEDLFKNLDNYFFDNWLVGFTEAEGSFYFIKNKIDFPKYKDNILQVESLLRAEFRISQNNNLFLLNKIKEKLKISRKVSLQSNSSYHYYVLAGSNVSIQNVINFYTNTKLVKFKGIKYLQFVLWLKGIKNVIRHNKIKIPANYGGDTS
jgi:LAGLIDADG endonuclease